MNTQNKTHPFKPDSTGMVCRTCGERHSQMNTTEKNETPSAAADKTAHTPIDWQALAISRYNRMGELQAERDTLRERVKALRETAYAIAVQRDELLAALREIQSTAHKHEVQYWLDAPGTDDEKLAFILTKTRDVITKAEGNQ